MRRDTLTPLSSRLFTGVERKSDNTSHQEKRSDRSSQGTPFTHVDVPVTDTGNNQNSSSLVGTLVTKDNEMKEGTEEGGRKIFNTIFRVFTMVELE